MERIETHLATAGRLLSRAELTLSLQPIVQLKARGEEEIRHRAYEIYLARSSAPGDEVEDWLQAERELRSR